jgi:hypothetical protein
VENLTRNFAFDADPSWSPDGTRIAFTSQRNGANQVFVMNADGSDQRLLLDGDSAFADWQPTPEAEPDPLQALADAVTGLGPGTSLLAKVNQAQAAVAAGNVRGACSILAAFIHEAQAQAGRKITPATATSLVGDATKIRNALGC